jgi:hypothetical protein
VAVQQIQKSSVFKPEMIGDLVKITVYTQADGSLSTVAGILAAFNTDSDGATFVFENVEATQTIPAKGYTITITHYEFIFAELTSEDDK